MEFLDLGYADERFLEAVNEDLHCPICTNVLKEPVHCGPNEHYFCKSCITRHLDSSQTCPCCMEELSLGKLKPPSRFVTNRLSNLKINCDNFSRGCEKILELGDLDSHVKSCGFSPVLCSNKGCSFSINKKDREQHESETCPFRKFQCMECTELKQELEVMKTTLQEVTAQLLAMENVKVFCAEIKNEMKHLQASIGHLNQARPQHQLYLRKDFIVLGGNGKKNELLNSVEIFNWSTNTWRTLKPMNQCRAKFSAVVYKNHILISGGVISSCADSSRCPGITDEIEKMDLNSITDGSEKWLAFPGTLPGKRSAHKCITYHDRLVAIGGYDDNKKGKLSDCIDEISLTRPYTSKLGVCRMPSRRRYHGAELFGDKIVISGGIPGNSMDECLDSVLEYDVNTKKCRTLPPLPFSVTGFATVVFKDKLVLLGGIDKNTNRLSAVVMYDKNTGKTTKLPSMKHKRAGCSAITTGNVIVVMGGQNKNEGYLNSVECFSFESYSWTELPPMKEQRAYACAVVKTG